MNSKAKSFFGLGIALVAWSLLADGAYFVLIVIVAALFFMFSLIILSNYPKRLIRTVANVRVSNLALFLGGVSLSIAFFQKMWTDAGIFVFLVAYCFLAIDNIYALLKAWTQRKQINSN